MSGKRFIMNAGRTTKQGQQVNVGKDYAEYQAEVQRKTQEELDEIAAVRFTRQQSDG